MFEHIYYCSGEDVLESIMTSTLVGYDLKCMSCKY